jgi:hypothetical protein
VLRTFFQFTSWGLYADASYPPGSSQLRAGIINFAAGAGTGPLPFTNENELWIALGFPPWQASMVIESPLQWIITSDLGPVGIQSEGQRANRNAVGGLDLGLWLGWEYALAGDEVTGFGQSHTWQASFLIDQH